MRYGMYAAGIAVLIYLDQLSKWWVTEILFRQSGLSFTSWMMDAPEPLGFASVPVTGFFNWVMVWNYGISFGMFNQQSAMNAIILSALALAIVIGFAIWLTRVSDTLQITGIALVIAGAIGNVIDRLRFGAVIDFIDLHVMGYHWPAFNAADSFICIGVFLLLIYSIFFENPPSEATKNTLD